MTKMNEIKIFIPSKTKNSVNILSIKGLQSGIFFDRKNLIHEVKTLLSKFGGYTEYKTNGGYILNNKIMNETILVLSSYCYDKDLKIYRKDLEQICKKICSVLEQDSVLLVINDDISFISSNEIYI